MTSRVLSRIRNGSAWIKAILGWLKGLVYFALISYPANIRPEPKPAAKPKPRPEWDIVTETKGNANSGDGSLRNGASDDHQIRRSRQRAVQPIGLDARTETPLPAPLPDGFGLSRSPTSPHNARSDAAAARVFMT